ncbi:sprT-like domain-containing protein Spartan isoform X2 [Canna indica]|uniref:SprT-like domain-containing protein Spartan isoform X2 n=1 Tax=Canna indica TaxID=4628 RepID=A0AAQ3JV19_9LILI|nr:sprT-like domain-containing protein Spartan isoform X2 [Canna indica]
MPTRSRRPSAASDSIDASEDATADAMPAAGQHADIHELFCHYNALYFRDCLGACAVSWSSSSRYTSNCYCYSNGGGCEIHLSEPLLKTCSADDLKNVLLHEMIHAFLWIEHSNSDRSDHGVSFQAMMNSINSSTSIDPQRPTGGYNVTVDHSLQKEQHRKRLRPICEMRGEVTISSVNKGPSASGSTKNLDPDECCDNPSCHQQSHKKLCFDNFMLEPSKFSDSKSIPKVTAVAKVCKEPRTSTSKEDICTRSKRLKPGKSNKECAAVIEWLGAFEDEESDDDIVPLVNKRSERRKKQKLLHDRLNQTAQIDGDTQQSLSPILMEISDG